MQNNYVHLEEYFTHWEQYFIIKVEIFRKDNLLCNLEINPEHLERGFIDWYPYHRFIYGDIFYFNLEFTTYLKVRITYVKNSHNLINEIRSMFINQDISQDRIDEILKKLTINSKELRLDINRDFYNFISELPQYRSYFRRKVANHVGSWGEGMEITGKDVKHKIDHFDSHIIVDEESEDELELQKIEFDSYDILKSFLKLQKEIGVYFIEFSLAYDFQNKVTSHQFNTKFQLGIGYDGDSFNYYILPHVTNVDSSFEFPNKFIFDVSYCIITPRSYITMKYVPNLELTESVLINSERDRIINYMEKKNETKRFYMSNAVISLLKKYYEED